MKLHLPLSLRASLFALFAVACTISAQAATLHSDISITTYTDFGQNFGRYKTDGASNALLQHIRSEEEKGVIINYKDGQYILPHEMPDFTAISGSGAYLALGNSAMVSVQHMNVFSGGFTSRYIGSGNEVKYQAIEYAQDPTETFLHSPKGGYSGSVAGKFDYKVSRLSKVVTDVESAHLFSGTEDYAATSAGAIGYVNGKLIYHAGAGGMYEGTSANNKQWLAGAYNYIAGGIDTVGAWATGSHESYESKFESLSDSEPLPFHIQQGDSGSPVFVYNEDKKRYEFVGAVATMYPESSRFHGSLDFTQQKLGQYDKAVVSSDAVTTLHIGAVTAAGTSVTANVGNGEPLYGASTPHTVSTTPYSGTITDTQGNVLQSFVGVKNGINTWNNLAGILDRDSWYNYGNEYLNASAFTESGKALIHADLFLTENLVFTAGTDRTSIILDADVDLGIGYAQFSQAAGQDKARFDISSGGNGSYQFNHAGYVIDKGVEVHTSLTGNANHVAEWRKIGEGDLYIEGSGDNTILLNVGGRGSTYLSRTGGGYAAYNVLANTGATVVIKDINQIKRDFTFGHQGGVLNMNGNDMEWNNSHDADADGFTIHALDELAVVANQKADSTTVLTWTQGGTQTFLGSFQDNGADSVLQFVYAGGSGTDNKLTLHSIRTHLTAEGSGMIVQSGTLALSGSQTVHAIGSESGRDQNRLFRANDWHYADAETDVRVQTGGTFELGSHARLQGDVTVESGGTYVMREGVQNRMEYVEGGLTLEDTSRYSEFFGHKGDISLANGATLQIDYTDGTTAVNTYSRNISGEGKITVDTADGAILLEGNNTVSGSKTITGGGVIAGTATALGNGLWRVTESGWIASHAESAENLLNHISTDSDGTLALSENTQNQVDLSSHQNMFVGAELGKVVHYGQENTALAPLNNQWQLGGGGGELVVDFLLSGNNDLILGADEKSHGVVTLNNAGNSFSGHIIHGSKRVILKADGAALGNATVDLSGGYSLLALDNAAVQHLAADSTGYLLVDELRDDIDLSGAQSVYLSSLHDTTYSGNIALAEGQAYRFTSAHGAVLTVASTLSSEHAAIVAATEAHPCTVIIAGESPQHLATLTVRGQGDTGASLLLAQNLTVGGAVSVGSGASLDISGQTLTAGGNVSALGSIRDSSGTGELVMNAADGAQLELSGNDVNVQHFRKSGGGEVTVGGSGINIATYHVDDGTLHLADTLNLTGSNTVRMNGGALHVGSREYVNFNIAVEAGGLAEIAHTGSAHNNGFYTPVSNYTGFRGNMSVGQGAELKLTGSGIYEFMDRTYGSTGGTINLACSDVYLYDERYDAHGTTFKGTLRVSENVNIHAQNWTDNLNHHIECLSIDAGKKLTLLDNGWNSIWNIESLRGEGNLMWNSQGGHANCSYRMILSGESDFSGSVELNRDNPQASRPYSAYIELASEGAARHAEIILRGSATTSVASLAVNAENAHIGGLTGNTNSFVYAGVSRDKAVLDSGLSRPATTRAAALTIDTDGGTSYTFAGTVGNSSDTVTNGLTLVKTGSGTQKLTGTTYLSNLRVEGGALLLSGTTAVKGDVALAAGASLNMGNLTLTSGRTFSVIASETGDTATFGGKLTLAGGTLEFDGRGLDTGTTSLSLSGGIAGTSPSTLRFTHSLNLETGKTYTLATGNWASIIGSLTVNGLDFYAPTFSTNSSGHLQMTLSMADGYTFWKGNEELLQENAKVIFPGTGGNDTVSLSADSTVHTGVFINEEAMNIRSDNGAALAFGTLEKTESGALHINTTVSADTMSIQDSVLLSGTGTLSIGSLNVANDAVVKLQALDVSVRDAINSRAQLHLGAEASLTTAQTTIETALKLGEADAASRVELGFSGSGLNLTGTVSILDNTTLSVKGSGALSFNSAFNNLQALELQNGVSMATEAAALSTHLVLNGGHATLSGNRTVSGNITVNSGSVLTAGGDSDDTLVYSDSSGDYTRAITINQGGELALGARRWSLGNEAAGRDGSVYKIQLNGGAISGNGTGSGNLDFFDNGTIEATGTTGNISAEIRIRNSDNTLNINTISKSDSLTIGGKIIGSGGITKDGLGTLHLNNTNNSYTGTTTVNGGVLRAEVAGALSSSSLVINDGGEAYIGGSRTLRGDTTVNSGGTLTFTGTDAIQYGDDANYSKKLTVDGGTVEFGSTRQTMANWELTLKNGAKLTGGGGSYNNSAYSAALDFNQDNTIKAEGTGNTISANIRLRSGNSRTLTYQVEENSDLTVSGRMHADTTGALGKVTKDGAGKLILSGQTRLNWLNTKGGEVVIAYTGADGNTIGSIDSAMTGGTTATGTLRLAENAKLTVTGELWSRPSTGILLKEGAELNMSAKNMVFTNRTDSDARLTALENGKPYNTNADTYELTNGHAKHTGTNITTLATRLTNSSVENAGSGKLTVNNAANSITDVYASAGDMEIMQQAAGLNLEELVVAADKTVSAYTGADAIATEEADVTVRGHAEFGKNAVLNANLTLASGSSLNVAEGGLAMGSTLSLQKGITLDEATLNRVYSLNTGASLALFTGVDGLKLGETSYTSISADDEILASPYFTNLNSGHYCLTYTGTDNGTLSILSAAVPEPTSSMLGLMGLVAFTFRRRRRK